MSVSLSRQRSQSYSAQSMTSSSLSLRGGMQQVAGGMQQVAGGSQGFLLYNGGSLKQGRSPSVYGGAGGYGTRISHSIFSSGSVNQYNESAVVNNEKLTMQNLNDRLASYLEKVRTLESANRTLELQIREYCEKRVPSFAADFTKYFAIITDLRAQILQRFLGNQRITLQMDNAQLAVEDFQVKYETELSMYSTVQADVNRLKGVRDSMTLGISDLQMSIESMKEELVYMRSSHQEELRVMREQQSGSVDVRVDSAESVDMAQELKETREEYEALMVKNIQEVEKWFQAKVDELSVKVKDSTIEVTSYSTELSEQKRIYQSLEISLEGILTEIQCRQRTLEESNIRFNTLLSQNQLHINTLELELQSLLSSIDQQKSEYNILLDIKMRLELEIAEYRRLLDGETRERGLIQEKRAYVIKEVVEVEEHKPHIERRTKTITEEIIDGKVVSSTMDTEVVEIQ